MGISMSKSVALLLVLVLAASGTITLLSVNAESKIIVVPDDYPTIAAAIGNATEGDTIYVKKGTYEETTLEINKTLSLIGEDRSNTIINIYPPIIFGGLSWWLEPVYTYDRPLKIKANNVKLSGFTITSNSSGSNSSGISRVYGEGSQITDNCIKTGLALDKTGHNITRNIIRGGIDCGSDTSDILIFNNNLDGVWTLGSGITIQGNTVFDDGIGIGGYGNTVLENSIENCRMGIGLWGNASNNMIYHNNFVNNTIQAGLQRRLNLTVGEWDNGPNFGGNFWSDYNGTDADGNGFGDTPYVIDDDNKDNYPLMEPIDIPASPLEKQELEPESLPVVPVAVASVASVAVVAVGLLVYFRKRSH
jgi:nitrous oxidase accessory protein